MNEDRLNEASLRPLIRFLEQVYSQNVAMKRVLNAVPKLDWKTKVLEGLRDIDDEGSVREEFARLYESLDNPSALHEVIQEFLKVKRTC